MLDQALQLAKETALGAGQIILKVYEGEFDVEIKPDETPITLADLKAHEYIDGKLKSFNPDYFVLSEEGADDKCRMDSEYVWIVDPLDGTKEFIKRNGEFTVNIALIKNGEIQLGVIYAPVFDELYYAKKGEGAYRVYQGVTHPMKVSSRTKHLNLLLSRSHQNRKSKAVVDTYMEHFNSIVRMGSSLKGCKIAEGVYDVYYNFGRTMKWDTCAMEVIVKEAGGTLKRLDNLDIDYTEKDLKNRHGFYIINDVENCLDIEEFK